MPIIASTITVEPSLTGAEDNAIAAAVAAQYAADIEAVPGAGPVCGVCVVNNVVYAFRDNVGQTKQVAWKASASGWAAIDFPTTYTVPFTSGSGAYSGGAFFLSQGGNTATVHRVFVNSGSLDGGDAAGYLILRGPSSPGALTSGSASGPGFSCTLDSGYAEKTLRPGGRWQFRRYQFSGDGLNSNIVPVYGVDRTEAGGGGNFIEFDGTLVAPIVWSTTYASVYPIALECHKNHLFIALRNSLWFSGIGNPGSWTVFSGGGEIVIGEKVTELLSLQGSEDQGALLVCTDNRTQVVYGNDSTDWNMVPLSRQVGAKRYSMQQIGGATVAYDQQGVRDFMPSQDFGNFAYNTLTDKLRTKVVGLTPTASVIDREGGHYRVFFDDGSFLSGIPGRKWSWGFCRYPFTVNYASEWEIDGAPVIFMSGDDGFVYQAERGRSFAGEVITAWLKTAYAHLGSPGMRKAFRRADIEIRSRSVGTIQVQADLSYGDIAANEHAIAAIANGALTGSDGAFDLGAWDEGTWDAAYLTEVRVRIEGVGDNVSLLLYSSHADELPHEVSAITHYFLPRRQTR